MWILCKLCCSGLFIFCCFSSFFRIECVKTKWKQSSILCGIEEDEVREEVEIFDFCSTWNGRNERNLMWKFWVLMIQLKVRIDVYCLKCWLKEFIGWFRVTCKINRNLKKSFGNPQNSIFTVMAIIGKKKLAVYFKWNFPL